MKLMAAARLVHRFFIPRLLQTAPLSLIKCGVLQIFTDIRVLLRSRVWALYVFMLLTTRLMLCRESIMSSIVVQNGCGVIQVRFFLEIWLLLLSLEILSNLLVLTLYIFDLPLEILELDVQGSYLLVSLQTARFVHRLSCRRI